MVGILHRRWLSTALLGCTAVTPGPRVRVTVYARFPCGAMATFNSASVELSSSLGVSPSPPPLIGCQSLPRASVPGPVPVLHFTFHIPSLNTGLGVALFCTAVPSPPLHPLGHGAGGPTLGVLIRVYRWGAGLRGSLTFSYSLSLHCCSTFVHFCNSAIGPKHTTRTMRTTVGTVRTLGNGGREHFWEHPELHALHALHTMVSWYPWCPDYHKGWGDFFLLTRRERIAFVELSPFPPV